MSFKKNVKRLIRFLIRPFVFIWFWFIRWIRHNKLLIMLNNKEVGKCSLIFIPFLCIDRVASIIKAIWREEFLTYTLKKYKEFLKIHYSKKGLGYFNYDKFREGECLKMYNESKSRIRHYITHNSSVLDYKDGDSFLDIGCGRGQSIKELISRCPNSSIKGFDVSRGALRIIQTALKDNNNVHVEEGSVLDFGYLESYPAGSFDHLIISHVFAFLFDPGVLETRKLRQALIDHFVRIANKSILIMDGYILSENKTPDVFIEQKTRCSFRESLVPYFSKHISKGELYAVFSPEDEGIVFKLKR